MARNLTLTTLLNLEKLDNIFDLEKEKILKIVVLSLDYKPIELIANKQAKLNKTNLLVFDIVGLVITIERDEKLDKLDGIDYEMKSSNISKKLVVAQNVTLLRNKTDDLICLGGAFDLLPNDLILEEYKKFDDVNEISLKKIDEFLEIPKEDDALKSYLKLTDYFSTKNYYKNNNVLKLLEHKSETINVAKKILIKSIVSWQIRK